MTKEASGVEEETREGGKESPAKAEPTTAPSDVDQLRQRNEELLTRMKYLQADFDNYRKRAARETDAFVRLANEALAARLLPVLDDFDAALAQLDGDASKGVRMVRDNLLKALKDAGLEEIPAEGQKFDPYLHDCVQQVPDPELEDGRVTAVVRKGYRFQDHVLRPAQVVVVKNGGGNHA